MSDDVFAIRTAFPDVAELGQGYLERADGERLLLPLPVEVAAGEGVRFIVYLADGTPAFAGAGRAVQASDQGTEIAPEERFETLIDGLVFDERSRPVYDYIVAVRQMAYADLGAAAEAEAADGEEAVLESEEPTQAEPADPGLIAQSMRPEPMLAQAEAPNDPISVAPVEEEPTASAPLADMEETESEVEFAATELGTDAMDAPFEATDDAVVEAAAPEPEPEPEPEPAVAYEAHREAVELEAPAPVAPSAQPQPGPRSLVPPAPGILTRPTIAAGWQPVAPERPQPNQGTGMFRYPIGTLPSPSRPPRPDLHPDFRVQAAPRAG